MNCPNCKINTIKKCKNQECNNKVRRCNNCWFDTYKNIIDALPFGVYIPLHMQYQISEEYQSKQLESLACGKCDYITKLFIKYGKNIPLLALMYEDVKINVEFDKDKISN